MRYPEFNLNLLFWTKDDTEMELETVSMSLQTEVATTIPSMQGYEGYV